MAKTFFFFFFGDHLILGGKNVWILDFGRKITLWILAKTFFFFFFFGDHLILGGKNVWISDLSETFRLKFRTNRLKLIQGQWKFEPRSFEDFSLFQNSPPPFPNPGYAPVCWWVILYSEKKNTMLVYFKTKKQKLLSQKNHWTDTIASAMLHRIKSFVLKARCRGARPIASLYSLQWSSEIQHSYEKSL